MSVHVLGTMAICLIACLEATAAEPPAPQRPNFLWISAEDLSPDLGCYGDRYSTTPTLDQFATESVRYTRAFTHAGVCAPSRSGIITGRYPTTIGTHHMRCAGNLPPGVKCFSEALRAAGYYCTNNAKTDYQFAPPKNAWDQNGPRAHWRQRRPGQPFFAVFNLMTTHESQIRAPQGPWSKLDPARRHDPAQAELPPYYPDTPTVRIDWARYADNVTVMDGQVRKILNELDQAGLADDTIVWFWGDHGRGLPRAKRWVYDSGIHIPLLIRVPEKWRRRAAPDQLARVAPGAVCDDLVAAVDFAPTMLALAGVEAPAALEGQAFLGPNRAAPREYIYAHRDRMDGRYDVIRAVRDKRFKYIRNYRADLPRSQPIDYMDQMPTIREMRHLHAEGKLRGAEQQFFEPTKPREELYDTTADPHEVHNLAQDPAHAETLARLRAVHEQFLRRSGDVGLIPEGEFDRLKQQPDWRRRLSESGQLAELWDLRKLDPQAADALPQLLAALQHKAPAMRYWTVIDLRNHFLQGETHDAVVKALLPLLADPSPSVRVAAAQALAGARNEQAADVLLDVLERGAPSERLEAVNVLDQLRLKSPRAREAANQAVQDESPYVQHVAADWLEAIAQERGRQSRD